MTLKAVHILDVPIVEHVPLPSQRVKHPPSFAVIGHRGHRMNSQSSSSTRENSMLSFNTAGRLPNIPFVEFDVQVTSDGVPVIFHDVFILTHDANGGVSERRVADLTLAEFLSYGLQPDPILPAKPLLRRADGGKIFDWVVEADDTLCTLRDAFRCADARLGFNIELKFADDLEYGEDDLTETLDVILRTVSDDAGSRPVIFSSFHPDAARILRGIQGEYPVFFLTEGGMEIYGDRRRNSLEEAVRFCLGSGLDGIVSDVRAVLRNPAAVAGIKEAKLQLMTYGCLNNMAEVVCMQQMMGIDGVIVDRVQEISEVVSGFVGVETIDAVEDVDYWRPKFSEGQMSFLRKLMAQWVNE